MNCNRQSIPTNAKTRCVMWAERNSCYKLAAFIPNNKASMHRQTKHKQSWPVSTTVLLTEPLLLDLINWSWFRCEILVTKHKHVQNNGLRLEICNLIKKTSLITLFSHVIFSLSREIVKIVKKCHLIVELKYGIHTPECVYHRRFLLGRGPNIGVDNVWPWAEPMF